VNDTGKKLMRLFLAKSEADRNMLRTPCREAVPEDNLPQLAVQMFGILKLSDVFQARVEYPRKFILPV